MFGQLQIKSAYSFGKSTILINELIKEAKTKHIDALGLCDEKKMYGIFEFYTACKKNNIRPIMGVEASVEIEIWIHSKGESDRVMGNIRF